MTDRDLARMIFPRCRVCGFWFWDNGWHSYVPSWRWPGWDPRQPANLVCEECADE